MTKTIKSFRIDGKLWGRFTALCRGRGKTASEVLRDFIVRSLKFADDGKAAKDENTGN